jgi:hypothetical protein
MRIFTPSGVPAWVKPIVRSLEDALQAVNILPEYRVAELPPVTGSKRLVFVSDAAGGAVPAFNDGANWRRVTDRSIIS